MEKLEIRRIPGIHERYAAGSDGLIYRTQDRGGNKLAKPIQMAITITPINGYVKASVKTESGKAFGTLSHVLVGLAFLGERGNKFINHKDGDKTNNRPSNLEYVTHRENIRHAFATGLIPRLKGEEKTNAKLTDAKVRHILNCSEAPIKLAKKYGVSSSLVCAIRKRKVWRHVR